MDSSDNELGGGQFGNFNLDAIAEFRVLQNNYSAEYGRGSGTIVSVVSKTGTNELHGSAFEFLRNDKLDARNFFAPSVAPFRRNEYGFTVGGPVWIPKIYNGKNKTFWFIQYAGFRQRLAVPVLFPVPTADERKGLVTVTPTSGAPYQLQVPVLPEVSDNLEQVSTAQQSRRQPMGRALSNRPTARPSTATSGPAAWISASRIKIRSFSAIAMPPTFSQTPECE